MHFIVYDLEATCWPNRPPSLQQEIIEIGAYKLGPGGEELGEFERLVRPVVHPMLSPFCRELTGIEQPDVNAADRWPVVCEAFLEFIGLYDGEEYVLASWGDWDHRQLRKDSRLHDLPEDWVTREINVKRQYAEINRLKKPWGLAKTVRKEGFEWDGDQHSALDDAYNLAKVFRAHIDEWVY